MDACACHDMPFFRVAARMRETGAPLEEVRRVLPCAETCTACLPDLAEYLAGQGLPVAGAT